MEEPAMVTGATLGYSNVKPEAPVVYTLTFKTKNAVPAVGAFVITYPASVGIENTFSECSVSVDGISTYRRSCSVNLTTLTVTMRGGVPSTIPAGSELILVLGNFVNPPGVES